MFVRDTNAGHRRIGDIPSIETHYFTSFNANVNHSGDTIDGKRPAHILHTRRTHTYTLHTRTQHFAIATKVGCLY